MTGFPLCIDCAPSGEGYTPCVRHGGGEHGFTPDKTPPEFQARYPNLSRWDDTWEHWRKRALFAEQQLSASSTSRAPTCPTCAERAGQLVAAQEALREIAKGEGAFSRDPLTHASNTIEAMKAIASGVLEGSHAQSGVKLPRHPSAEWRDGYRAGMREARPQPYTKNHCDLCQEPLDTKRWAKWVEQGWSLACDDCWGLLAQRITATPDFGSASPASSDPESSGPLAAPPRPRDPWNASP